MHVQFVALCEQVILGADGKPSLIGVINDMPVPGVPATIPRLAFAARLLFSADEAGSRHKVEVVMKDPKDGEIARPGTEITIPSPPPGIDSLALDLPLQFDLFGVQELGRYTFLLQVDGKAAAAVQLLVHQVSQGPSTA